MTNKQNNYSSIKLRDMKKLILSLATVAALASCATNENETPVLGNDDPVEIKVGYASLEATTKAPFEGTINSDNPLTALVMGSRVSKDYTSANIITNANGTITFKDNGASAYGFDPAAYFEGNADAYLCGLYPTEGWGSISTTAQITFDGDDDVMAAKEVTAEKGEEAPTLEFLHKLTKLMIQFKSEDGAPGQWGKVTKIELTKVGAAVPANVATVTLETGTVEFSGTAVTPCYVWNTSYTTTKFDGQSVTLPDNSEAEAINGAYVLCQPTDAQGTSDYTLKVYTENMTGGVEVPINCDTTGDTTGKEITVTLTFKTTQITAKATVKDWENGGTASGNVEA